MTIVNGRDKNRRQWDAPRFSNHVQGLKINQGYWNVLIEQENVGKGVEEGVEKKPMLSDQRGKEMQNQANKSGQICESRNAEIDPEVIHEIMRLKIIKPPCNSGNVRNRIGKPSFGSF